MLVFLCFYIFTFINSFFLSLLIYLFLYFCVNEVGGPKDQLCIYIFISACISAFVYIHILQHISVLIKLFFKF